MAPQAAQGRLAPETLSLYKAILLSVLGQRSDQQPRPSPLEHPSHFTYSFIELPGPPEASLCIPHSLKAPVSKLSLF